MKSFLVYCVLASTFLLSNCATPRHTNVSNKKRGVAQLTENENFATHTLSIMQGLTDKTSTQISILIPLNTSINVTLKSPSGIIPADSRKTFTSTQSGWRVSRYAYKGLELGTIYTLEVANDKGVVLDTRELQALDTSRLDPKIALISCMNDKYDFPQHYSVWNHLNESPRPDIIFFLGDNVYVDTEMEKKPVIDEKRIWLRYVETRLSLPVYRMPTLVPILATWDDHDFGFNDEGKDFPYKAQSTYIFQAFFAQDPVPGLFEMDPAFVRLNVEKANREQRLSPRLGIASKLRAFNQDFYFLDSRTFRDKEGVDGKMLGSVQSAWLEKSLSRSTDPAWIMSGSQFFGGYQHGESFEREYPTEFKSFLEFLRRLPRHIVLVSGDRHMSEIMDISKDLGYPTFELSSSGIHSYKLYGDQPPPPNARRVPDSRGREYVVDNNFMVVDLNVQKGPRSLSEPSQFYPDLKITVWGEAPEPLYAR